MKGRATRVQPPLSIQFRLTASYTAILALTFALIGAGVWLALNRSIDETADRELHSRLADIRRYVDGLTPDDMTHLEDEFREESLLTNAVANIRIGDRSGKWLYRTPSTEAWPPAMPVIGQLEPQGSLRTIHIRHDLIRVLTAPVRVGFVEIGLPIDEFEEVKVGFIWLIALASPLLLLLAAIGGYWMAGRALRPIEESVRRMTEFTADASHELRTPVAIMQTTAELMQARPRTQDEHVSAWKTISGETERTSSLIRDLLTLARADAGKVDLEMETVNLSEVAQTAVQEMRVMAAAKGLRLQLTVDDSCPVVGDRDALRRAVCILLDNAIKFTPAPGDIKVGVKHGSRSSITVSDTGVGIQAAELPRIFERFYRVSKDRSRSTGGAGLGLSIGHWIVNRHRGEIRTDSAPGKGSTFTIFIPSAERDR